MVKSDSITVQFMSLPKKIAFVDVETTGCRHSDRIIEIGIVLVEQKPGQKGSTSYKLIQKYNSLVNPGCRVPEEILQLTGILPTELENAPSFNYIKKDILELLEDAVFVAHNVRFDYSFIRNELKREELSFRNKHFCTVKLSRKLFPEYSHHNLDSLIDRFGFKCKSRHRAFDDAFVLWQFWQTLLKTVSEEKILAALNIIQKRPTVPVGISEEILEDLPDTPGVYIFYGENGMPLYVGKSINLRDRVLSHFSSDHLSSTEMQISQQIKSIETIQTSGELGALFKESFLIKKLQPLYNRLLRNSRLMTVLKGIQNKDNYFQTEIDTADNVDASSLEELLGVFRNLKSTKQFLINICKEFELCEKLLGIEKTTTACFGYRLGRCKGACLGKEHPARYNMRFTQAFSKTKIRPWPFQSPIIIQEKDDINKSFESFLIDKWCYLGSVKSDGTNFDQINKQEVSFDVDTYKILLRYLSQLKNQKNIKLFQKTSTPIKDQEESSSPELYL